MWREQKNHFCDYYFCIYFNILGINRNNRDKWSFLPSVIRPVSHGDLVLIPSFFELPQLSENESCTSNIAKGKESMSSDSELKTSLNSDRLDELNVLTRELKSF